MADQGRWFKLWITANTDPDLENLSLENFGRWCRFGAFLKAHGTRGTIKISPPGKALCNLFRVQTFDEVLVILRLFPNTEIRYGKDTVTVEVTWRNWLKYQEDTTAASRNKKARALRSKKRGEEKRGEEKRSKSPISPKGGDSVFEFWKWGFEKTRAKFTPDRRKKVAARLNEGFTPYEIVWATVGCSKSPMRMGQNDRDTVYDDLTTICKTGSQIEKLQVHATEQEVISELRKFKEETGIEIGSQEGQGDTSTVVHSGTGGGDEEGGN